MNQLFLSFLSQATNNYLKLDPESAQRLAALEGNVITIELLPFHFIFQCEFTTTGVRFQQNELLVSVTHIKGTPLQMVGAMLAKENRQRFFADDLVIEGNADIGLQLVALFDDMQIDWEEYFSRIAGDNAAHHVGRVASGIKKWFNQFETSLTQSISEYIQEEKQWLPTREALQDFFHDIDTLRMDSDRIEAKMKVLKNQLGETGNNS